MRLTCTVLYLRPVTIEQHGMEFPDDRTRHHHSKTISYTANLRGGGPAAADA